MYVYVCACVHVCVKHDFDHIPKTHNVRKTSNRLEVAGLSLSHTLSLTGTHIHTHTHTQRTYDQQPPSCSIAKRIRPVCVCVYVCMCVCVCKRECVCTTECVCEKETSNPHPAQSSIEYVLCVCVCVCAYVCV